jgi:hypothetical protein
MSGVNSSPVVSNQEAWIMAPADSPPTTPPRSSSSRIARSVLVPRYEWTSRSGKPPRIHTPVAPRSASMKRSESDVARSSECSTVTAPTRLLLRPHVPVSVFRFGIPPCRLKPRMVNRGVVHHQVCDDADTPNRAPPARTPRNPQESHTANQRHSSR